MNQELQTSITTKTSQQTQELGREFARKSNDIQVLALHGDLGSGKTTFVQGLAHALGIDKRIISPTFIIMRTYQIPPNPNLTKKFFYHIDLYRVASEKDIQGLGIHELMQDPQNLLAIEWPEKIAHLLSDRTTHLYFNYKQDDEREIVELISNT